MVKAKRKAKVSATGKAKVSAKGKAKAAAKEEGKKKAKQYKLSPDQHKQLKEVLLKYRQAEDAKNKSEVAAILKNIGEKFITDAEVSDEAEKARIKTVGFPICYNFRHPFLTKILDRR